MRTLSAIATLLWLALINGRRQTAYLVLTLTVATAAWLVLAAVAAPIVSQQGGDLSGVSITNGSQTQAPLPLRYARRIELVKGAKEVAWLTPQVVQCGAKSHIITLNAYDGPGAVAAITTSQYVTKSALQRWAADPLGILISERTAHDCGWTTGQGIDPDTAMGGKPLALHVSGIFHESHPDDVAFAHFEYINRNGPMLGKDQVLLYTAHAANPHLNEVLAARIEQAFAHDFPTVDATTNATVQNAWARFGKVQQLLALVMTAIFLCTASVLVSVLAHAAAQRRYTFALLQVFGFRRHALFAAFTLEILLVLIVGAALGTGIGTWIEHEVAMHGAGLLTCMFTIPLWAYAGLPVGLALLWVVSLAWPAALIRHLRPIDLKAA